MGEGGMISVVSDESVEGVHDSDEVNFVDESLQLDNDYTAVDKSLPTSMTDKDRKYYNILKRLPALVDWFTICFCAVGVWLFFYVAAMVLLIFLLTFQLGSIVQGIYMFIGALKIRNARKKPKVDIVGKHLHVCVLPNYKEDLDTLRRTLDNLAAMSFAKSRFCIILGMEGGEAGCEEKADELQREYAKKFWRIAHSVHARGIPGETSGKHSNENAAGRFAYKMLVKEQNIPIDSILLTCMDADCLHTENYFLKIDAAMQKEPKLGYNTIFACAFFNYQNMMDPRVPRFNAYFDMMWACVTLGILARRNTNTLKFPASSYTVPMRFLRDLDFWDVGPEGLAEDEHMALKAFFATQGQLHVYFITEVMNNGTVFAETKLKGIKAKLVQLRRHFQSNVDVGYALAMLRTRIFKLRFSSFCTLFLRLYELFFLLTMSPIAGIGWLMVTIRILMVRSLQPPDMPEWFFNMIAVSTILMNLTFFFIIMLLITSEIMKGLGPEKYNTVPGNRRWWDVIQYLWMLAATVAIVLVSIWARAAIFFDLNFKYVVAQRGTEAQEDPDAEANGVAADENA